MGKQQLRLMVVGAEGGLGTVVREIAANETDWSVIEITRDRARRIAEETAFDSGSRSAWRALFEAPEWRPDVVINAAAITNVDWCETNRTEAWRNNVTLVENIVGECKRHGSRLIQISSDYVFDGNAGPYTEAATPNPLNYYGKTKLAAENACIGGELNMAIVRTMWLYGEHRRGKPSFVTWLLDTLMAGTPARVVTDEIGNPTYLDDLAYAIIKIIDREGTGILNIAGPNLMSRWDFAQAVVRTFDLNPELLIPVTSGELQRVAKRPISSGLISLRAQTLFGLRLTSVADGLSTCRIMEHRAIRQAQ